MIRLLLLILTFASSISHATTFECTAFGVNIPQIPVDSSVIYDEWASTGVALQRNGKLITLYDRHILAQPEEFRNHVLAHECAHHQLGHTSYRSRVPERERTADCLSISLLKQQLNYSEKEFTIIFNVINNPDRFNRMQSCNSAETK